MEQYLYEDYLELCTNVAAQVIEQISNKPDSLITIAGGDTPKGVFAALRDAAINQRVDYSQVKFLSLDEWLGLDANTKGSCRQTLDEHLFIPLGLRAEQIVFFDGAADNMTAECTRIDQAVEEAGGIDLIILGIGMNGHLGFNEPDMITEKSSIVKLATVTKEVMIKYFEDDINLTHGITLGYEQILGAKQIILMASGVSKRVVIKQTIEQAVNYGIPATILKTSNNCNLYLDTAARGGK